MDYTQKVLTYQDKAIFTKTVMGKFNRIQKYFKADEACFMFIENGTFLMRTPEETILFEAGDGMLAKCGNYFLEHKVEKNNKDQNTIVIGAYFYPSIVKELFDKEINNSPYHIDYDACKVKVDSLLLHFKESISVLLDNPELADENLVLTKLKEFLLLLSRTNNAPSVHEFTSSLFKPYEYNFKTIIEKNQYSSLSLPEFAALCDMSLATFKRKFTELFSESPRKYISRVKVTKASQLLRVKEHRITDIAYDCGFESTSTFNRIFKKHYGQTPTDYRLSHID